MPSEIEIKARALIWEDSESNFESENHVFKKGEEVVILDPLRRKIGDGVSTFNELKFDTKHNLISLGSNASTVTIYNVIPQTLFSYRRSSSTPSDVILLLDSFKDSNRGFTQCDGRMHKIYVENGYSTDFEVEVGLTSLEIASGSKIIDIGNVSVPSSSSIVIEFCWLYDVGDAKVCYYRVFGNEVSFSSNYLLSTVGELNLPNEEKRLYIIRDFNITSSTIIINLNKNNSSENIIPKNKVEHYCLVKNSSAAQKTVVIQGVNSGDVIISEGLTSIPLPAGKSFEFSYVWLKKGTTDICVVTKSNILSEVITT